MGIHKSLKAKSGMSSFRNVLTRRERIKTLMRDGKWSQDDSSVYALPKMKLIAPKARKKKEVKKTQTTEATAQPVTTTPIGKQEKKE
jgi:small basic protein (TIGR04137 family)